MARMPRIDVPGAPQHLIARGNNRAACFLTDQDRHVYLRYLAEAADDCACAIHAYVLMTNHVHLLATGHEPRAISRLMQSIGRRYARYFNHVHERTGTLYEGRFKSSLIDSDAYFLTVMRYVELNPVRAGLADHPVRFRWSSFRANASGAPAKPLTPHALYLELGGANSDRARHYQRLFDIPLEDRELHEIRTNTNKGKALGHRGQVTLPNK